MESRNLKNAKQHETLVMDPITFHEEIPKFSENSNPNVVVSHSSTPLAKSKPNPSTVVFSPRNRIRERRFVVVKKNSSKEKKDSSSVDCKCGAKTNSYMKKCVCIAYETLRTSQEEFFNNPRESSESEIGQSSHYLDDGDEQVQVGDFDETTAVSLMKRRREKVLEEARMSLPEFGKVMHLVKAFEKLTCFPISSNVTYKEEDNFKKPLKWELPGMSQQQPNSPETETDELTWRSSFSPSDLVLTATNLGLVQTHASVSSSWDNSLNSNGGRRSRRNSLDSSASMGSRRSKKTQIKVTSLKPFKLRTEERGRMKEEEFAKKLQEMKLEEEKLRIPIAQGLPWTTDEPENLVKPHVKDITIPVDLKLHSDIRAVERAEFDYQVAEKINLIEQYKTERQRQQKLAEEEEIRRLRKELVPKAQPMPTLIDHSFPKGRTSTQLYLEIPSLIYRNTRR